jgi:hypothetical protein
MPAGAANAVRLASAARLQLRHAHFGLCGATQSGSLGFSALSPLLKRNQNVSEVSALLIRRLTGLVVGVAPENVRPDRTTGLVGRNPLLLGAFL